MDSRSADETAIIVCAGGRGAHAFGAYGCRDPHAIAGARPRGSRVVLLVVEPLPEPSIRRCHEAGIAIFELERVAPLPWEGVPLPADAFPVREQWLSRRLADALRSIAERSGPLEVIEFPDRGGWAFATLQDRLLGQAFVETRVDVRLEGGSSQHAAYREEPRALADLLLADLERKCLADCDGLVAESAAVGESIRRFHGFEQAGWDERLSVAQAHRAEPAAGPARVLCADSAIACRLDAQSTTPLPVLARALAGIVETLPGWTGPILLSADDPMHDALRALLPPATAARLRLQAASEGADTEGPASVWIDADPWSTSTLPAMRAVAAGAICVVHRANPAYADAAWLDGETCFAHDGTSAGVVSAVRRAFDAGTLPLVVRRGPSARPATAPRTPPCTAGRPPAMPSVTVVVPHRNLGAYLAETVESARRHTPAGTQIVVVDDASDDPASRRLIDGWAAGPPEGVRVLRLPFNVGLGAARNVGVEASTTDYVVPLDADDLLAPGFVARAVSALHAQPAFDLVVPQAAYFTDSPREGEAPGITGYLAFVGEARESGLHVNRFSTATCVMRRGLAARLRYREDLEAYEDWDFYLRAVAQGSRFIVDSQVGFFYRRRSESMIHAPAMRARHASLVHRLLAPQRISIGTMEVSAQALEAVVTLPGGDGRQVTLDGVALGQKLAELERFHASRLRRVEAVARRFADRCAAFVRRPRAH